MAYASLRRAAFCAAIVIGAPLAALAQGNVQPGLTTGPQPVAPAAGTVSPFLLEPDAQVKGDRIKQETYRSQPAGQNQNWNLDIGRFQPKINEDPNGIAPDLTDGYSGMRLRLPLGGGLRQ